MNTMQLFTQVVDMCTVHTKHFFRVRPGVLSNFQLLPKSSFLVYIILILQFYNINQVWWLPYHLTTLFILSRNWENSSWVLIYLDWWQIFRFIFFISRGIQIFLEIRFISKSNQDNGTLMNSYFKIEHIALDPDL